MVNSNDPLAFYQFWKLIAREVGSAHLIINDKAIDIHNLISADSDAKDFLRTAIKQSYKDSQCHNLHSTINLDVVLDILGETAYQLRHRQQDDLFDIELLEEIAWHIGILYPKRKVNDSEINTNKTQCNHKDRAKVISFPDYKIRQVNSRL